MMAGIDYYSCDVCNVKTFYDAGINYRDTLGLGLNISPKNGKLWPAGNVGWMTVLCKDCAAKHRVEVVREDSSDG
jgi:hypothetical protein